MLFEWLASKVREAFARGAAQGLADIGVVPEGATPQEVRQAIADKPAAEDRKDRPRGGGK
jgi:hypothetical protein